MYFYDRIEIDFKKIGSWSKNYLETLEYDCNFFKTITWRKVYFVQPQGLYQLLRIQVYG